MGLTFTDFSVTMARGDDEVLEGTIYQDDGVTEEDITGWDLWFTGKLLITSGDVDAVFQKTIGDGITVTDAANGAYEIAIDAADTDGFAASDTTIQCDLQAKDTLGKVKTLLTGRITVKPEVTRTTA